MDDLFGYQKKSKAVQSASYHKGVTAEHAARAYLQGKGFELLEQRYKTKLGEIDLIMRDPDGETLVAIEVKTRQNLTSALEAITPRAQKRIAQSLLLYLTQNPDDSDAPLRFDVVAILPNLEIHHIDNAWQV